MNNRDIPDRLARHALAQRVDQGVLMKRVAAAMMAALMMLAWPAAAQQPPDPPDRDRQTAGRDRDRSPAREASWPGRDGHDSHGGRMSREERQQLRRDINSHGRDIYRQDRGRR